MLSGLAGPAPVQAWAGALAADSLATTTPPLLASLGALPKTVKTEDGAPADPLNVIFVGSRAQLEGAFSGDGWQPASRLTLVSAAKMVWNFLDGNRYPTAPVSSLYYGPGDKHKEDLAFEREDGATVKKRDHVRFWDTGHKTASGQEIWVGSATQDVGVEWNHADYLAGPTHRISPNVDAERNRVSDELTRAHMQSLGLWQRGSFATKNGEGDPYHTDGAVAVFQAPATAAVASPMAATRSFLGRMVAAVRKFFSWL